MQHNYLINISVYYPIICFFIISSVLSLLIIILPNIIAINKPQKAKLSPYECGFEPAGDARGKFDVKFYLIAILFIIFDIEIAFLFPWAASLKTMNIVGFFSMISFLAILTIGFIYEWKKGALDCYL